MINVPSFAFSERHELGSKILFITKSDLPASQPARLPCPPVIICLPVPLSLCPVLVSSGALFNRSNNKYAFRLPKFVGLDKPPTSSSTLHTTKTTTCSLSLCGPSSPLVYRYLFVNGSSTLDPNHTTTMDDSLNLFHVAREFLFWYNKTEPPSNATPSTTFGSSSSFKCTKTCLSMLLASSSAGAVATQKKMKMKNKNPP